MYTLLLWFLVSVLSGTIHTLGGFGFGIVGLAIMQIFSSNIPEMAALFSIISLGLTFSTVRYCGFQKVKWKLLVPTLISYMIFQPIANKLVLDMDIRLCRGILGGVFMVIAILSFLPSAKNITPRWYLDVLAGALSGTFAGLFSVGSTPLAIYFVATIKDRDEYLSTISTQFFISDIYATIVRILYGIITVSTLPRIGAGYLGMFLGLYFGRKILKGIPSEAFKRTVYIVIGFAGAWYLVSSILGI